MYQTMFGVEGSFPGNDWTYEAYVSTGHTTNLYLGFNGSQQRYQSLVSAPNWGNSGTGLLGLPVQAFTYGAGYAQNCSTGLPTFGGEWPAANCIEAIQSKMKALTEVEQDIFEFNLQGKIADMRSGELRFAAASSHTRQHVPVRAAERQQGRHRSSGGTVRVGQHVRRDDRERDLRRAARAGDLALEPRVRLPLLGLQHGGRRGRHVEDAVRLCGDRLDPLARRFPAGDPRAEHGGDVPRADHADGSVRAERPLLVHDAGAVGQHHGQPEAARCSSCVST